MEELHEARKDDRTEFQRDMTVSSLSTSSFANKLKYSFTGSVLYTTG